HVPPLRVKIHAAPTLPLSARPPTMAVLPSADNATEEPCWAPPTLLPPTSFAPCCAQLPPGTRVNTHAAPSSELSKGPPIMAVLPLPDSATEEPCRAAPIALPIRVFPSRVKSASADCVGQRSAIAVSAATARPG